MATKKTNNVMIDIGTFSADTLFNMKMELYAQRVVDSSHKLQHAIEMIDSRLSEYYEANIHIKHRHEELEAHKLYATYLSYPSPDQPDYTGMEYARQRALNNGD